MIAIVRTGRTGNLKNVQADFKTKKAFKESLKGNGYRVLAIFTSTQANDIKDGIGQYYNIADPLFEAYEYIRQCL